MRVECGSIADFLQNLAHEFRGAARIHNDVIYLDVTRLEEHEHKELVNLQASAVVCVSANGDIDGLEEQYLLQAGEDCGWDYTDGEQEQEGTDNARRLTDTLEAFCEEHSLTILPGKVSE